MKSIFRPLLAAMAFVCLAAAPVMSQTTAVSASHLGGTAPFANATIYWQAIVPARVGSNQGQVAGVPQAATVTAGAFGLTLADALASSPNTCYAVTAIDNATGMTLLGAGLTAKGTVTQGGAYGCVQPTGSTWSFDTYVPPATPPAVYQPVPGPQGAAGANASWNWRGNWAASTAYAKNDAYVDAGNVYVTITAYTSGSTFGSTDLANTVEVAPITPTMAAKPVPCAGSDDTAAINTVLATGGHVAPVGNCVMGASSGSLIISADNTWLDLGDATLSYSPGTTNFAITDAAATASAQRTFADAVLSTSTPTTITSATASFTAADVGQSLSCAGGMGTAGSNASAPDLHTSILQIVSSTSITIAQPVGESATSVSCSIYTRAQNIKITGGTIVMGGPAGTSSVPVIKMKTVNNLDIEGVTIWDGLTNATEAGGYNIEILDTTGFTVRDVSVNGWTYNQDGVHLTGPDRQGVISNVLCSSGDDCVAVGSQNGNCFGTCDTSVYGLIDGVTIGPLTGSSSMFDDAVHIFGPADSTDTLVWVKNIGIHDVAGTGLHPTEASNYPIGFISAVGVGGDSDNITLTGSRGNIGTPIEIGGNNPALVGNFSARDISYQYKNGGYSGGYVALVQSGSTVQNMIVCGVQASTSWPEYIFSMGSSTTDASNSITHLHICDVQGTNLAGGTFLPFRFIGGTVGDFSLSNVKMSFNGTSGWQYGLVSGIGAAFGSVSMRDVHLTFGSSFTISGLHGLFQTVNLSGASGSLGSLVMDDISLSAPSAVDIAAAYPDALTTFGSIIQNNVNLSYMMGCFYTDNATPTYSSLTNFYGSNLSSASSCVSFSPTSGTVTSASGTATTAHSFTTPFIATPKCEASPYSNAGAWYFSTLPSTTSSGVITYATSGAQTFSETCTGAGGAW